MLNKNCPGNESLTIALTDLRYFSKLCSEHKMYLCFRSAHCQNVKTIASPPAEISIIDNELRFP